jgi:hypothetical protein
MHLEATHIEKRQAGRAMSRIKLTEQDSSAEAAIIAVTQTAPNPEHVDNAESVAVYLLNP